MGETLQKKTIEGILASVDLHYPEFAPWQPINYELDENQKWVHRNFLQITTTNFRQPLQFDGGPAWYTDENNKLWSPLSTIINMNDGVGTYVFGNPVTFLRRFAKFQMTMTLPNTS